MHPTCTPSSLEDVRADTKVTELTEVKLLAGLSPHFCCHMMCPVKPNKTQKVQINTENASKS